MNALKKYSIAYKGLGTGRHEFDFKVGDAFFKEFGGTDILGGDIDVKVSMLKQETLLQLDFTITGAVRTECDRCLDEVTLPVSEQTTLYVRFSETEEESDGEIMWISPNESEIDLGQYIYETIYLGLPAVRAHQISACNKDMLSRLTVIGKEEFEKIVEQKVSGAVSPWSKLEELKYKRDEE